MRTVTFYSYKGGVGRTLALGNVARYLSQFGQRVFAIDLDLEAPGLHYKLLKDQRNKIERGFVDYLNAFLSSESAEPDLRAHVIQVEANPESGGRIDLMPAGRVPSADYWRRLAQVDWHELFYSDHATGVPFFLELKARIAQEFQPDFLLIDARTGITEIGGVATTILPDKLICMLINNEENLEGARAVLRSMKHAPRMPGHAPVEIVPVLARIPDNIAPERERELTQLVKDFLEQPSAELAETVSVGDVFVLHTESALQVQEYLKFGERSSEDTSLLRDYLRLFQQIIPAEVIRAQLGPILKRVMENAFDDPDAAQKQIEALAAIAPHIEVFRALLRFYRLRNSSPGLLLRTAERIRQSGGIGDPLVNDVVRTQFLAIQYYNRKEADVDLALAVWNEQGATDVDLGIALAQSMNYVANGTLPAAPLVYRRLLMLGESDPRAISSAMTGLVRSGDWELAMNALDRSTIVDALKDEDLERITDQIVSIDSEQVARRFLDLIGRRIEEVRRRDINSWASILYLAGRGSEVHAIANQLEADFVEDGITSENVRKGRLLRRLGRFEQVMVKFRERWSDHPSLMEFLRDVRSDRPHRLR